MNIKIEKAVERKFRAKVSAKKGELGRATTEAIEEWLEKRDQKWGGDEAINVAIGLYTKTHEELASLRGTSMEKPAVIGFLPLALSLQAIGVPRDEANKMCVEWHEKTGGKIS